MLKINERTKTELKMGETAAKYSCVVNLLLAIIKGVVGYSSGSIALIADSIHSFSDIAASFAVYIGLKLSRREPDKNFPYGYYRMETLASLIVSAMIIIVGYEIVLESYDAFLNPTIIDMPLISLFVAVISVVVSFALAKYKEKIGKKIGSQALINDGKHSFIDIFSSIIVFIGIFCSYLGFLRVQGISGMLIAFLIIYLGLKLAKDDVLVLLDASMDPEKITKIRDLAEGIEGVKGVHDVKIRRSGPFILAELHLEIQRGFQLKKPMKFLSRWKLLLRMKSKIWTV
ncbi:cation diffusion facilitator family transporter [Methanobacterium petrolearium]|uniref:cation diffusion facilitator family transporter n=1 Tax=Methanobacterium petrolearium TaxID=710190 RepID=UPI0030818225